MESSSEVDLKENTKLRASLGFSSIFREALLNYGLGRYLRDTMFECSRPALLGDEI